MLIRESVPAPWADTTASPYETAFADKSICVLVPRDFDALFGSAILPGRVSQDGCIAIWTTFTRVKCELHYSSPWEIAPRLADKLDAIKLITLLPANAPIQLNNRPVSSI